ncbi:GGDEF domain-containing protein [Sphingomonas morindae]|uniref:diguanylate cyclase n=1 Tax=Sphingomonas morindae TaxID=1541170 RepID=A0ABY4X896_9SPHN|nr:GGDEF domain-containing protein [Sphingomonas morindae]USI73134.1 GGDEF domain-containing protein [Sphingomonas morindae]
MSAAAIVLISLASTTLLVALAMMIAWRRFGHARAALLWSIAFGAGSAHHAASLARVLLMPRGALFTLLSTELACASFALIAWGFLHRAGSRLRPLMIAWGAIALVLIVLFAGGGAYALSLLRLVTAGFEGSMLLVAARALHRSTARHRTAGRAATLMLVLYAVYAVSLAVVGGFTAPGGGVELSHYHVLVMLGVPIGMIGTGLFCLLLIAEDLAERLRHLAHIDPLTQILNRRGIEQAAAPLRAAPGGFAVVLADLDRFKAINDRFGHGRGDDLLCRLARYLETMVDGAGLVGRLGGEEFLVLLPRHDEERAGAVAERLRAGIGGALGDLAAPLPISASFGVAVAAAGRSGETLAMLIARADAALYHSKLNGRDQVSLAPPPGFPSAGDRGTEAHAPHDIAARTRRAYRT